MCITKTSIHRITVDQKNRQLWVGSVNVRLTRKVFDLLLLFLDNPGKILSKDEILQQFWPDTVVTSDLVKDYVAVIRRSLKDKALNSRYIETIRLKGYRYNGGIKLLQSSPEISNYTSCNRRGLLDITQVGDERSDWMNRICHDIAFNIRKWVNKPDEVQSVGPSGKFLLLLEGITAPDCASIYMHLTRQSQDQTLWCENYAIDNPSSVLMARSIAIQAAAKIGTTINNLQLRSVASILSAKVENFEAQDYVLYGKSLLANSVLNQQSALQAFKYASKLDPKSAEALEGIARCYHNQAVYELGDSRWESGELAADFALKAHALDKKNSQILGCVASALALVGNFQTAGEFYVRSLQCNPADTEIIAAYGFYLGQIGKQSESVKCIRYAMSLVSECPDWYYYALSTSLYQLNHYEEALEWISLYNRMNPDTVRPMHGIVAMCGQLEKIDEAENYIQRIMASKPTVSLSSEYRYLSAEVTKLEIVDLWLSGYKKAEFLQ